MKGILLTIILILTIGCTKEDYCGIVTGGRTGITWDGYPIYILEVDGKDENVDQKTYESFFVGDSICLSW